MDPYFTVREYNTTNGRNVILAFAWPTNIFLLFSGMCFHMSCFEIFVVRISGFGVWWLNVIFYKMWSIYVSGVMIHIYNIYCSCLIYMYSACAPRALCGIL